MSRRIGFLETPSTTPDKFRDERSGAGSTLLRVPERLGPLNRNLVVRLLAGVAYTGLANPTPELVPVEVPTEEPEFDDDQGTQ
jgi:hypothetical protein